MAISLSPSSVRLGGRGNGVGNVSSQLPIQKPEQPLRIVPDKPDFATFTKSDRLRFGSAKLINDFPVRFSMPVTKSSAAALSQALLDLADVKKKVGGSVKLIVNSPGGVVDEGFHVIDTMENLGVKVDTIVLGGMSASMGALIFISGSPGRRFMSKNARLLIHQPSAEGIGGTQNQIEETAQEIKYLRNRIDAIISQKTGVPIADVKKMTDKDTIIYPLKALKMGFTDWVLTGDQDKALGPKSVANLSMADIEKRDQIGDYSGLVTEKFDAMTLDPAKIKGGSGGNILSNAGGGGAPFALVPKDKTNVSDQDGAPQKTIVPIKKERERFTVYA